MWIDTEKLRFEDYSESCYGEDELMTPEEQAEFEASFNR
jgi:hypothetical protein